MFQRILRRYVRVCCCILQQTLTRFIEGVAGANLLRADLCRSVQQLRASSNRHWTACQAFHWHVFWHLASFARQRHAVAGFKSTAGERAPEFVQAPLATSPGAVPPLSDDCGGEHPQLRHHLSRKKRVAALLLAPPPATTTTPTPCHDQRHERRR